MLIVFLTFNTSSHAFFIFSITTSNIVTIDIWATLTLCLVVCCLLSDRLTALRPTGYRDELRRFRPGLDYTVAHHGAMTVTARLDATLCFVDDDRITLLDESENENENEDTEHEKKRKDKEGNKPVKPAKKGLYSLSSVF